MLCLVTAGCCDYWRCSCWLLLTVVIICDGLPGVCLLLWLCVLLLMVYVGVCEYVVVILLISVGCPDYVR